MLYSFIHNSFFLELGGTVELSIQRFLSNRYSLSRVHIKTKFYICFCCLLLDDDFVIANCNQRPIPNGPLPDTNWWQYDVNIIFYFYDVVHGTRVEPTPNFGSACTPKKTELDLQQQL